MTNFKVACINLGIYNKKLFYPKNLALLVKGYFF